MTSSEHPASSLRRAISVFTFGISTGTAINRVIPNTIYSNTTDALALAHEPHTQRKDQSDQINHIVHRVIVAKSSDLAQKDFPVLIR